MTSWWCKNVSGEIIFSDEKLIMIAYLKNCACKSITTMRICRFISSDKLALRNVKNEMSFRLRIFIMISCWNENFIIRYMRMWKHIQLMCSALRMKFIHTYQTSRSSKDADNARTAEQAKRALHLLIKACWTLPRKTREAASTFAFAKLAKKWAVSTHHLHPTSAARTTRRTIPPSPDNSGNMRSLRGRTSSTAPPLRSTKLVTFASCHRVRPSAVRTWRFEDTRAAASESLLSNTPAMGHAARWWPNTSQENSLFRH